MDFISGLPRTLKSYTVIWVVVDRLTKSAHFIPGKSTYTANSRFVGVRLRNYADERRRDLEFDVGDMIFLKVAPIKGVLRFEKKGKLSPRFVGSFEILERIGPVAYHLALPPQLSAVHDVFHVSMLRKYVTDPSHIVDYKPLQINDNLSYDERPVEILAKEVKLLCNRGITLVKVLWRNHEVEEAT
ncbi:uncharacterized protein LOC116406168 [Cucumis sativus]|uniref:uncharacterized protein LOC116404505 n=1 Tax=Cucumis sativus TaxID=3659 RepID=UPI0012F52A07|nr:uncharacterized protein LOC116404505 [Cucumis sativus]XP_031745720.1 uncharacterized protein LOC116406168 [Cucumis sativus]